MGGKGSERGEGLKGGSRREAEYFAPGVLAGVGNDTVKPPIKKDTPKEDKPPNKGQAESTLEYKLHRKSPLKKDNLSTKDKMADPKGVLIKRYYVL